MSKGSDPRTYNKEADERRRKNKFYDDCEFERKKGNKSEITYCDKNGIIHLAVGEIDQRGVF